ncbi:Uncharacterized protein APZ42_019097 [Daphnia magna]|uniref:Uncharacterized protein n=1 Tax=Daphnia magna TaxID=35525 RepID=A0A0P5CQ59_9CRUS|nr:Uncharacterized protein APZ42_019097 [Daphnia magna]
MINDFRRFSQENLPTDDQTTRCDREINMTSSPRIINNASFRLSFSAFQND